MFYNKLMIVVTQNDVLGINKYIYIKNRKYKNILMT